MFKPFLSSPVTRAVRETASAMLLAVCLGAAPAFSAPGAQPNAASEIAAKAPQIQLAILLDTSNSMDGLINQTREQLWQMVDELGKAKRNGVTPTLQVAVFEYGNDGLPSQSGHLRQVVGLTTELDRVSEALFSLTTNGGNEYCGYAIDKAVTQLQWSSNPQDMRLIFIAGNEPFTQGPVDYTKAVERAGGRDITVSTIFAGERREGIATGWMQGAQLSGGSFMSIDHNQQIAHVDAPQDAAIARLNQQLNDTYIAFGKQGKSAQERQRVQDSKSADVSQAYLAKRAKAKASSVYRNTGWDLVDAMESGSVDLDDVETEALPEPMQSMSKPQREAFVAEKKAERESLQREILKLSEEREAFVEAQRKSSQHNDKKTFNDAIKDTVGKLAEKKEYTFAK
ncbi:vWA domain-containing protein [Thiosocius teredinicola]|uniref:vWA domain-containing protein n=1 Tax=Thiosocius teredinicola TaxID=1973002 RepID=UPI0009913558